MLNQPTSSPMMKRIFGRPGPDGAGWAWACAVRIGEVTPSVDAAASAVLPSRMWRRSILPDGCFDLPRLSSSRILSLPLRGYEAGAACRRMHALLGPADRRDQTAVGFPLDQASRHQYCADEIKRSTRMLKR